MEYCFRVNHTSESHYPPFHLSSLSHWPTIQPPPPKPPDPPPFLSTSQIHSQSFLTHQIQQPHSPWQELPFADGRTIYYNRITKVYTCIPPASEQLQHRDELFRSPSRTSTPSLAPPRTPPRKAPLSPPPASDPTPDLPPLPPIGISEKGETTLPQPSPATATSIPTTAAQPPLALVPHFSPSRLASDVTKEKEEESSKPRREPPPSPPPGIVSGERQVSLPHLHEILGEAGDLLASKNFTKKINKRDEETENALGRDNYSRFAYDLDVDEPLFPFLISLVQMYNVPTFHSPKVLTDAYYVIGPSFFWVTYWA